MTDPDPVEFDSPTSEDTDEDRLRVDPLEQGMEPPEQWTAADKFGNTPAEQREGESLDDRLREEQPDVDEPEPPNRPISATPAVELDETIDDVEADVDPVAPREPLGGPHSAAAERGQSADEAGGSVADAIRTPPDE